MSQSKRQKQEKSTTPPQDGELRLLLWNLVALLGLGALASWWILVYTDWLPAIGGLLTLTGAFAWLAILFHLISEERKDEIQRAFERRVLLDRSLWKVLLGGCVGLAALTAVTTTVEVRTYRDDTQRSLVVHRAGTAAGSAPIREVTLPPRSSRKLVFFGYGPFLIKPSGLPAIEARGGILQPRVLVSPDDFTRSPVLLIRPDVGLSALAAASSTMELAIARRGEAIVGPMPYRGRAIWVGCDQDTAIPEWILRGWEPEQPVPWLPAVAAEPLVVLKPDDELVITLKTAAGTMPEIRHTVRSPNGPDDFVQQIVLELPGS